MIIAICLITFHKHKVKTSLLYLAFNIMLGGMAEILYLGGILNGYILLISLVFLLCLLMIYKIVFKGIKSKNLIYQLIIIENKKKIVLDAYLDTGNFLQDYNNNPVIVVNKRFKNYFKRPSSTVPCQTVNNISYMNTYKFEKGYIKLNNHYKEIEGSIVFSNIAFEGMIGLDIIGGYQCLDL